MVLLQSSTRQNSYLTQFLWDFTFRWDMADISIVNGGYSKFVFLGQGKWMNVMINQGIWVFWGNFPWFSDKAMWLMRCRTAASQVNRSRFAQWKERRRSSSKSEWVSSNWPWSRTQQLCHAMLLDALISTPPTPICSSSQGNGSERASTDPDWDSWMVDVYVRW